LLKATGALGLAGAIRNMKEKVLKTKKGGAGLKGGGDVEVDEEDGK
jgi:hypothetical protein